MDNFDSLSLYFPRSKEQAKRAVICQYPHCNLPQPHNDQRPTQFGSSRTPIYLPSAHLPLTLRSPSQQQDTNTSTKRSRYHARTKEIIDRSYILRPTPLSSLASSKPSSADTTHHIPHSPHLRSISQSHPKPRPTSLFPLPRSESPLHSPLTPLARSSSRLPTSQDILPQPNPRPTHNQNLSRSIETTIGLPPKYTLQLNLPGDCSSLLVLSEYDFGISDMDTDIGKADDQIYAPTPPSAFTNTTPPTRRRSQDARSTRVENSSGGASQEQQDIPPGQRLSASYFDFGTDSSESDITQVVSVHRKLTTSTNSSKTCKKRADRSSTPRATHPPAKFSHTSTRPPHKLKRSNSRSRRNSPSLYPKVSIQQPHSRQCSWHAQNDVASILHSLSPVRPAVPPLRKEQYRRRHMKLIPALAALTPPSLFAPSPMLSRNSDYASSAKKDTSIPPSSPTSHFDANSGVSIKVDISKVMSHTMYAPSHLQPAPDLDSPFVDIPVTNVVLNTAENRTTQGDYWPRTPFVDMFQQDRVPVDSLSPEGIVHGINVVRKSERRYGWSGEWNQPRIEDVIRKLRTL